MGAGGSSLSSSASTGGAGCTLWLSPDLADSPDSWLLTRTSVTPGVPIGVLFVANRCYLANGSSGVAHTSAVNGQFDVPAGGQLKVLTPRTAIRAFALCDHPLSGEPRACGTTRRR